MGRVSTETSAPMFRVPIAKAASIYRGPRRAVGRLKLQLSNLGVSYIWGNPLWDLGTILRCVALPFTHPPWTARQDGAAAFLRTIIEVAILRLRCRTLVLKSGGRRGRKM